MNDLTTRVDPPTQENEDFEAERLDYEDEHGMDNWGQMSEEELAQEDDYGHGLVDDLTVDELMAQELESEFNASLDYMTEKYAGELDGLDDGVGAHDMEEELMMTGKTMTNSTQHFMHLVAEGNMTAHTPEGNQFLCRMKVQSIAWAADMIASVTTQAIDEDPNDKFQDCDVQATVTTTTNSVYIYTL